MMGVNNDGNILQFYRKELKRALLDKIAIDDASIGGAIRRWHFNR
jgi:hypothetical protein